jgi:Fe-Mn family superoxide dismutase
MKTSRRTFIRQTGFIGLAAYSGLHHLAKAESFEQTIFQLPPLGYSFDALEPYIDAQTMQLHHDKHHQTYVTKLNEAIATNPGAQGKSLEQLFSTMSSFPDSIRTAIKNHGGGHWNHTFFWQLLKKGTTPSQSVMDKINESFGTMDAFKKEFEKKSTGVFGSGWTWLIQQQNGKLTVINTPNQENPLMETATDKGKPVLALDVWEHAYYLKYQNRRADYIQAFWNVLNWDQVAVNLK